MKKVLVIIMMIVIISAIFVSVSAVTDPGYNEGLVDGKIKDVTGNVWATIVVVVRVAAVACVVFAGVRYMLASADQKADIKSGLIYLAIGATLIFASTYVVTFIADASKQILN